MFSRIIVATDRSPASFAVVNCLGGLRAFGAKQTLLLQCLNFQQASSMALWHRLRTSSTNKKDIGKAGLRGRGKDRHSRFHRGQARRSVRGPACTR